MFVQTALWGKLFKKIGWIIDKKIECFFPILFSISECFDSWPRLNLKRIILPLTRDIRTQIARKWSRIDPIRCFQTLVTLQNMILGNNMTWKFCSGWKHLSDVKKFDKNARLKNQKLTEKEKKTTLSMKKWEQ